MITQLKFGRLRKVASGFVTSKINIIIVKTIVPIRPWSQPNGQYKNTQEHRKERQQYTGNKKTSRQSSKIEEHSTVGSI